MTNEQKQQLKELQAIIEKANEQIKAINDQPEFEKGKPYHVKMAQNNPNHTQNALIMYNGEYSKNYGIGHLGKWLPGFDENWLLQNGSPATTEEWESALKAAEVAEAVG